MFLRNIFFLFIIFGIILKGDGRMKKKIFVISFFIFIIDLILKQLVMNFIDYNSINTIIPDFFYLTYVKNTGGAWSILSGNIYLLLLISLMFLTYLIYYLNKKSIFSKLEFISYSLLIGGLIGNLFDRIVYSGVIDYIGFILINYNFPVFNLADICIVISVFMLLYIEFRK